MIGYFVIPLAILGALFIALKVFGGKEEHRM
jgi:hypothetical protein